MSRDEAIDWKGSWPWGRQSPARRMADLARRREEALRRKKRLEQSYLERMVDIDRLLEGIDQDLALASKCEADRCRRRVNALGEALERRGIERPKTAKGRVPDQAMVEEFEALLRGAGIEEAEPEIEIEIDEIDLEAPGSQVDFEEMAGLMRRGAKRKD